MVCIGLLTLAAPALAQRAEAQKLYDSIFKAEEDAAAKTLDKKDDVEFAAKLLKYAGELSHEKVEDRELKTILLLKAFEFGVKDPTGTQTAIGAMELLPQVNVELKGTAQENILKVRQMLFDKAQPKDKVALGEQLADELIAAGDERLATRRLEDARRFYDQAAKVAAQVKASTQGQAEFRVKVADSRIKTAKEIDTLKAHLQAWKAAETAKKLVMLNLVEMDDVEQAARFLDDAQDETLKRIVGLCNKDAGKLTASEALELGDWFRPLVKTSSDSGKAVSVSRARCAYEQYMKVQTTRNAEWLRVKVAGDELARLSEQQMTRSLPGGGVASTESKQLVLDLGGGVKMVFVLIPAGRFIMGSPAGEAGREDNETQHEVAISKPFYMGVTEVTQEQYEAVMGNNPSRFKGARNPVERVTWNGAVALCERLSQRVGRSARLPSEAEWEYACRAGTKTPFHTGDRISMDEANSNGSNPYDNARKSEYRQKPITAGGFRPNAWGLCDMHGNVWEWCSDWYGAYPNVAVRDPTGPDTGTYRILRGGSWEDSPRSCRSAFRLRLAPGHGDNGHIGLRVCLDLR
jgi:formylglycine-generating enzyme required for sulfatase activity